MTRTRAILSGGLVVGILDGLDAVIFFGLRGVRPIRIFQAIASGLLGMNLFDGTKGGVGGRIAIFVAVLAATSTLTAVTVAHSKRFADILDVMSDARVGWKSKWRESRRAWNRRSGPRRGFRRPRHFSSRRT